MGNTMNTTAKGASELTRDEICQYIWAKYIDAAKPPLELDESEALRFFEKFYSKFPLNDDSECFFYGILLYEQAFSDDVNRARYLVKAKEVFDVYRRVTGDTEWDAVEDRYADVCDMISSEGLLEKVKTAADLAPEIPGMVLIPSGPFLYGPDRKETVLEPFYIDIEPLTNARYREFLQGTSYRPPRIWEQRPDLASPELPVTGVSWMDALQYCKWANKTLPTAEQWEKAARGAEGRIYPWGDADPTPEKANLHYERFREPELRPATDYAAHASPYGVIGMTGGVWEWTNSVYAEQEGAQFIKGGSYVDPADPRFAAASAWQWANKKVKVEILGFRCTKMLEV
ncbi:MAG: formylglycine-generating enzyme family protein [Planctomycetota bacterium]